MTPLQSYFPIGLVLIAAFVLAVVMLTLAGLLGPRRYSAVKNAPFECGSVPVGTAREKFSVKFYVLAILFIVFDIEAIFLYPWAVLLLPSEGYAGLGWGRGEATRGFAPSFSFTMTYNVLALPYWALVAVTAIAPALWLRRWRRVRRWELTGHCPRCGYDLRAEPDSTDALLPRCPECGAAEADADAWRPPFP